MMKSVIGGITHEEPAYAGRYRSHRPAWPSYRRIVEALVARLGVSHVAASSRDPGKARDLAALGMEVRHGDYEDPDSLSGAFAARRRCFLYQRMPVLQAATRLGSIAAP